ncbi:MAG: ATP-binding protein [Rickettsiales bacterium]|nr:ATP-binding protein [Rickettsiales bacterium]
MLKDLPIGIQTFEKIVEGNYLYVDKTKHIHNLITKGSVYFLSRPRRFGKSLLISTLNAIFKGRRELFKGLWIEGADYAWQEYPIIRIDMSKVSAETIDSLRAGLKTQIHNIAREYSIEISNTEFEHECFEELIQKLSSKGKVVILIDEYDKPLINNLKDVEHCAKVRDILRNFYGIIKASDEYLKFVLLTGVSKFSKVSVFSGLNNLNDISMDVRYSEMLGYTQEELEENFKAHIEALSLARSKPKEELLREIKRWYNGYRFSNSAENLVYNPFSSLLLFDKQEFKNFWFETATPTFLVDLLKQSKQLNIKDLDGIEARAEQFSTYDIDNLRLLPLLVQAGYMTIKDHRESYGKSVYVLGYPNEEVRSSFLENLMINFAELETIQESTLEKLQASLGSEDLETYFETLQIFFANIPYNIQVGNRERYYQSIFYVIHQLLGYRIKVEVTTNIGRLDAVIELEDKIYIFEFKLNGTKEEALAQIKTKKYYQPYEGQNKEIILVGVEFNQDERNIAGFVLEKL